MRCNGVKDERVDSQIHKYGYEAFLIVTLALLASIVVKVLVFKMSPGAWLDTLIIFAAVEGYFTIRCLVGGVLLFPANKGREKKLYGVYLYGGLTVFAVWLVIKILFSVIDKDEMNTADFISMIVGGIIAAAVYYAILTLSQRFANKSSSDDEQ